MAWTRESSPLTPTSHGGQLVTVLYRLADEPQVQTNAPFTDVSEGSYYAKAVAWAYGMALPRA